jgi:ribosome-associated toxin RatA of RatAB toxin-antitoxin module
MRALPWLPPLLTMAVAAESHAQSVTVREAGDNTSEVMVVVDASPAEIYSVVTDYANWQQLFSDITSVKVKSGGREDARVALESRSLGQSFTVGFDNTPNQLIRFRGIKGPPGGKARGEYTLTAIGDGSRTRVVARLYMDVKGVASWFVADKTVRAMRRQKLAADINDTLRWFARRRPSS